MLLLSLLPTRAVSEAVPATLWAWTWIGGIVANAFFLTGQQSPWLEESRWRW